MSNPLHHRYKLFNASSSLAFVIFHYWRERRAAQATNWYVQNAVKNGGPRAAIQHMMYRRILIKTIPTCGRSARFVNPAEKNWMQQGFNLWLQGVRPAPKPLNHKNLLMLKASFFHLAELTRSEFWLNLQHSRRPKQTFVMYARLIYEAGATKLSFFFNSSGPKKELSLSLDVKCDQQTHIKKKDVSNYGINPKKIIQQSPKTILPICSFLGNFPIRSKHFLLGSRGFLWVWIMGSWNVRVRVMGVTSENMQYMLNS